jgi:hypothetical protein
VFDFNQAPRLEPMAKEINRERIIDEKLFTRIEFFLYMKHLSFTVHLSIQGVLEMLSNVSCSTFILVKAKLPERKSFDKKWVLGHGVEKHGIEKELPKKYSKNCQKNGHFK